MAKIRKPLFFALCLLPIAIAAGIFVGYYQLDTLSEEIITEFIAQVGSADLLIIISAVQTVGYALFCGFFGYILAEKCGLWKPVSVEKKATAVTLTVSAMGGLVFSLDHWVFGSFLSGIQEANAASLTIRGVLASVLYGGIIEEVLMRLFFMSLLVFILWKLFAKKYDREHIPGGIYLAANILAALLFAAGHLPATFAFFGSLTPLLLFRCFLLNGGFALIFGWLYRKYGILYAMMSHGVFHIVSKLIWILFI